jgi:hypothetical protein
MRNPTTTTVAVAALLLTAACGESATSTANANTKTSDEPLPQGSAPVNLNPANFTVDITNEYWPMAPGRRWTYIERDADGTEATAVVTVTEDTKVLANGITARVVRDTVTRDGEITEDTFDFYAQDNEGNLWYLGEDTAEFDNGQMTSTAGSFEAGANGALPGIAVPAKPVAGMAYRQEYLKGEAEDNGEVLSTNEMAEVPTGMYRDALLTKDTTPLEPNSLEYKLYAKGVGPVMVLRASGGTTRTELIKLDTVPPGTGTGPLGAP